MSVAIELDHLGGLRVQATHGPSGQTLCSEPPTDNGGSGNAFSPTDLVATALGSCVLLMMGMLAERNGLDLSGTRVHVEKHMVTKPLRRIGRLAVTVHIPADKAAGLDEATRDRLERAALHCPVHQSLHPDVEQDIRFEYLTVPALP